MGETNKVVEVTQRVGFSCSYLTLKDNKYDLNSINYKFEATVCGDSNYQTEGRVISFEDFTRAIKSILPDKSFIYSRNDLSESELAKAFKKCGICTYSIWESISAERLLNEISLMLVEALKVYPGVHLKETKLRENSNSYVSWKQEEI